MTDTIHGTVWRYGDDVDTDVIIPSEHMRKDPEEYANHVMGPIDPEFASNVEEGDIVVAERNFGIGSSREQAAIGLKTAGIKAIVAESFGRIFYRNAINQGLLAVTCDLEDIHSIDHEDELEVYSDEERIVNLTSGETFSFHELDEPVKSIYEAGGAKAYYTDE